MERSIIRVQPLFYSHIFISFISAFILKQLYIYLFLPMKRPFVSTPALIAVNQSFSHPPINQFDLALYIKIIRSSHKLCTPLTFAQIISSQLKPYSCTCHLCTLTYKSLAFKLLCLTYNSYHQAPHRPVLLSTFHRIVFSSHSYSQSPSANIHFHFYKTSQEILFSAISAWFIYFNSTQVPPYKFI